MSRWRTAPWGSVRASSGVPGTLSVLGEGCFHRRFNFIPSGSFEAERQLRAATIFTILLLSPTEWTASGVAFRHGTRRGWSFELDCARSVRLEYCTCTERLPWHCSLVISRGSLRMGTEEPARFTFPDALWASCSQAANSARVCSRTLAFSGTCPCTTLGFVCLLLLRVRNGILSLEQLVSTSWPGMYYLSFEPLPKYNTLRNSSAANM